MHWQSRQTDAISLNQFLSLTLVTIYLALKFLAEPRSLSSMRSSILARFYVLESSPGSDWVDHIRNQRQPDCSQLSIVA